MTQLLLELFLNINIYFLQLTIKYCYLIFYLKIIKKKQFVSIIFENVKTNYLFLKFVYFLL